MATALQITLDSPDPARIARFWAAALGYVEQAPPPGFDSWPAFLTTIGVAEDRFGDVAAVVDPDGVGPRIFVQRVPEPKTAKNRMPGQPPSCKTPTATSSASTRRSVRG